MRILLLDLKLFDGVELTYEGVARRAHWIVVQCDVDWSRNGDPGSADTVRRGQAG
jgi:hypothetical protein